MLIDSEIISARILIEQLASAGVHVDFAYVQKNFLGRSWTKVAAEIRISWGLDLTSDFEEEYRRQLLKAFETELKTVAGVEDVLDRLGVPCCVATSSSPKRARRSLELAGLAPRFGERLFTASQVRNGKPAPDLFLHAAREMDAEPAKCLVVEDSVPGLLAARAAGMQVWRFTGAAHLRGVATEPLPGLPELPVFDNWARFYEMAPQLARKQSVTAG